MKLSVFYTGVIIDYKIKSKLIFLVAIGLYLLTIIPQSFAQECVSDGHSNESFVHEKEDFFFEQQELYRDILAEFLGFNKVPKLTNVLRYEVSQYEAENVCCAMNKGLNESLCEQITSEEKRELAVRLPTIQELVLDAIARNTLPLDAMSTTKRAGDHLIMGSDKYGNLEPFYYPKFRCERPDPLTLSPCDGVPGYERPIQRFTNPVTGLISQIRRGVLHPTAFGTYFYWSSSVDPENFDYAYNFSGTSGSIKSLHREKQVIRFNAVRCVDSR